MSARPKIVVVGSLNVDHTLRVPRIPAPGETLTAHSGFTCFGGKGANQAVAAARAGGEVALVGCVGDDAFGARYVAHLRNEGIRTDGIASVSGPTGSAFIAVDDAGENSIIVNPAANHALRARHLDTHAPLIRSASVLLLQLECPLDTVMRAIGMAADAGVPVILNPSPLTGEFIEAGVKVDFLLMNESEAAALTGMTLAGLEADSRAALAAAQSRHFIITRGSASTLVITAEKTLRICPPSVTPVDTVGAGDSFAGAFAVAHAGGTPLDAAIRFANAAGALATQTRGAQPSIPTREAIIAFLAG